MKFKGFTALIVAFAMILCALPVFAVTHRAEPAVSGVKYSGSYYTDNGYSVTQLLSESGSTLKSDLTALMTNTHSHITTYKEIRGLFVGSDADPAVSGNILLCYSGASVNGTWDSGVTYNREHVWPRSLLIENSDSNAGADLHHIRPENQSVNSSRSNYPMSWVDTATKELAYNNVGVQSYIHSTEQLFEPRDEFKGDAARIYFYLAVRWGEDLSRPVADTTLETLLQWNELDPVDEWEMARNDYVETVQGNRNVFIDYPEFGRLIYGDSTNGFNYTPVTSGDYSYYVKNGNAVILSYNGSVSSVTIPSAIDGYSVTELGCASFANNSALTSVSIPSTVTKIGTYAFFNDAVLQSVTVGSGSKIFARRALRDCPALNGVYFYGEAPTFDDEGADQIMISGADNGTAPSGLTLYYVSGQSGWTSGTWASSSSGHSYPTATWDGENEPTPAPTAEATDTPAPTDTPEPGEGCYKLVTDIADITEGDYVLYGVSGDYTGAMNNALSYNKLGATAVTLDGDTVVDPDASVIWHMAPLRDGSFSLYNAAAAKYAVISINKTSGFTLEDTATYGFTVADASENAENAWYLWTTMEGNTRAISIYQTDFRAYNTDYYNALYLYKYTEGASADPTPTPTPTPEPTGTPAPTDTPEPTATPVPFEGSFELVTGIEGVTEGDYVIYGVNGDYCGAMTSEYDKGMMGLTSVTIENDTVIDPAAIAVWHMASQEGGSFTLYNEAAGVYCYISGTSTKSFAVGDTALYGFTVTAKEEGGNDFFMQTTMEENTRGISIYQTDFRTYNLSDANELRLYKLASGEEPSSYTVTFVDWDGTVLSTQQVEEGNAAVAPDAPARLGYTFTGWDVDFSNVTSDLTVTAQYSANTYTLTINYVDENGDPVADPFVTEMLFDEPYSIPSPEVAGYTAGTVMVDGVMDEEGKTITVVYSPIAGFLLGDANCDGKVTMADVSALIAKVMNVEDLTEQGMINADANRDGRVDILDAAAIYAIAFNN